VSSAPDTRRVRHEAKRRNLQVARVETLAPKMLRVVLQGEELKGFTSLGFDDHVKLFFAAEDGGKDSPPATHGPGRGDNAPPAAMRDFTPRWFDAEAGELWIDFFLHEAGPAASWASRVAVGQSLTVGGPRGSFVISLEGIDSHVLIGDETALPAMSRRLSELPSGVSALAVIETDEGSAAYPLQSRASLQVVRIARTAVSCAPASQLINALRTVQFPAGRCFVWVAAESQVARAIRRYLTDERGIDKRWVKAAGYWQRGATGVHDNIADED
jgi:NADPH-dependent ferric siderophore reductase